MFIRKQHHIELSNSDIVDFSAGITKGRISQTRTDAQKQLLWNRLLTESGGKASSVFEFVPIILNQTLLNKIQSKFNTDYASFVNKITRYSYVTLNENNEPTYFTNLRTLLRANINESILNDIKNENIDMSLFDNFKIIWGHVPYKFISHLVRHRKFSFEIETSRDKRYKPTFYIPTELSITQQSLIKFTSKKLYQLSLWLKRKGIKSEIANMFLPSNRLVYFAMAGWKNDSDTFDNLFHVRSENTGTLNITNTLVNNIKKIINE